MNPELVHIFNQFRPLPDSPVFRGDSDQIYAAFQTFSQ